MQCPYFTVTNYSAFDSAAVNYKEKPERMIAAYEFEFYTQDCEGGIRLDGVFLPARKGYFSCSKPGQRQKMVLPYKCYFFNICTEDEDLCALLDRLPDYSLLWQMKEVESILKEMLTVDTPASIENRIHLQGCVCRILNILSRTHPLQTDMSITKLHSRALEQADKFIREHYSEVITLEHLAEQLSLHPNYFHQLYTTAFGITPAQRLLACRIAAAKAALLTGRDSMSDIAASCGFSCQTYFGYKFKKVTGFTPLQYRKKMLSRK